MEAFNINWNSGLISAIASFLLKGEDFEKLNDFLISSEIEDGRLAFGFYGCICGFANLSRVFTSSLYSSDLDYLIKGYKTIFKQLHNIELSGELPKEEKPKINVEKKKEGYPNNELEELIQEIQQNVPDFLEIKKEKDKQFYRDEIFRLFKGNISSDFIKDLENIEKPKGTISKWKKVISFLKNKSKQMKAKKPVEHPKAKQKTISFGNSDIQLFFQDNQAFDSIEPLINIKVADEFKVDLIWFQEEYKKGDSSSYYKKAKRDNKSVLESFKRYIEKKKYVKSGKVSHTDIDKILIKLKEKYL